jgi:eukaryotic translation initiation factor 2C
MQSKHAKIAKPQYLSNLCMKINAKLGGSSTALEKSPTSLNETSTTMIIGADVSHASPANATRSYASMVGSTNVTGTRFAAIANTNGTRTECISKQNITKFFLTLMRTFKMCTRKKPDQIVYFRDGVSESQYGQIIRFELEAIKQACHKLAPDYNPKFTVVICTKRHHFRMFPFSSSARDRNGNPVPGVVIERDITHPLHWDFFLNSHAAIQGTSRPVLYTVIWDENKFTSNEIQSLIYNSCYTYIRATCSVSLVPATYYAHLAAARARCHDIYADDEVTGSKSDNPDEQNLRELHDDLKVKMWFI